MSSQLSYLPIRERIKFSRQNVKVSKVKSELLLFEVFFSWDFPFNLRSTSLFGLLRALIFKNLTLMLQS